MLHLHTYTVLPRSYAPCFCDLLPGKREGGRGVTMRTCAFALQLSPPPSHIFTYCDRQSSVVCGRSTCRGSTEGWRSCRLHIRTCCYFLKNTAGTCSCIARLLPPATDYMYRTAPLLHPPFLRPTFRKKRGGA